MEKTLKEHQTNVLDFLVPSGFILVIELSDVKFITVIELSGMQLVWDHTSDLRFNEFKLKSQVWFQIKISRDEVQRPLHYIHFEIANFRIFYFGQIFYRSSTELIYKKLLKICLSFSCNSIGYFKKTLKSDRLLRYVNKSYQLEPIRLQGSPLISKRM